MSPIIIHKQQSQNMKKFLAIILFTGSCLLLTVTSCKKDEAKLYFNGGTAPVLTGSVSDSIPLQPADSTNTAVTFNWTNPNYNFSNGVSSLDVTYYLQVDTAGANFTSIYSKKPIAFNSDLSTTFTVSQFNSYLGNTLGLALGQTHNIQVRVQSFISPYTPSTPAAVPLNSNVLNYSVTPYIPPPLVEPPSSGQLFLVGGDAKLGGWANPVPGSQQFTQVSSTEYTLTIALSGGDPTSGSDQYLFLPVNGSWTNKYACNNTGSQPFSGGSFGYNGGNNTYNANFPGPAAGGTYKFDVNFQNGIITVTKQ
jgi:hypothetical protein